MTETKYVCPGCRKYDMSGDCWHTEQEWEIAVAMRDGIARQHPRANERDAPDPVEAAWGFIDEAGCIASEIGDSPYLIDFTHPNGGNYVSVGIVNRRYLFGVVGDEETYAEFLGDLDSWLSVQRAEVQS